MSRKPKWIERAGMRSYRAGPWIITRDRPWRWWVRHGDFGAMPADFFAVRFSSLGAAAEWAWQRILEAAPIVSRKTKRRKSLEKLASFLSREKKHHAANP